MKRWYAVSTKHNLELLALKNLERQHIHTYLPRVSKKSNIKNSFNRIACRAFFPGYLFVMLDLETDRWQKINSTIGVRKIVNIGSCPVPISSKIINKIKKIEDKNGIINQLEVFEKNENIVIENGIFSGSEAIFDKYVSGDNRVRVLLNLMGITTGINLSSNHIQKN